MSQPTLFNLPDEPANMPAILANPGNRPYGKGRPCTPAAPGSGPAGETCGGCALLQRIRHHDYRYLKCAAMAHAHTHGPGTDIKAKWPACATWEPKDTSLVRVAKVKDGPNWLGAAVYRRKGQVVKEGEWTAEISDLATLAIWYDFMIDHGWNPLRAPGPLNANTYWPTTA